jgi:large subunit ribosomal protein L19
MFFAEDEMSIIDEIMKDSLNKKIPRFKAGDTVRVYLKIKEGEKERVQYYEGVVIGIHKNGISTTFKVRKESYGVGVERTFPLFSPLIQKIEVKRRGDVRRAKLYYLRKLSGKKARIKEKKDWMLKKSEVEAREAEEEAPPVEAEEVLAATAEVADTAPAEGEVEEAMVEETVEATASEDAAADAPATPDVQATPQEEEPVAEVADEKTAEDSASEVQAKEEEGGKKPRGKKKS